MVEKDYAPKIKRAGDLYKVAIDELKMIQKSDMALPKTGMPFIDSHIGGLLPGDVVLISALSGHGKTYTLNKIRENLLNVSLNSDAAEYVFLDINLEMRIFNLLLRSYSELSGIKKSDLLKNGLETLPNEIKDRFNDHYKSIVADSRHFIIQDPLSSFQYYKVVGDFLEENKTKKAVFVSLDHALLLSGSDKQKNIESLSEYVNQLKLKYPNSYFFIINQGNRELLRRSAERSNASAPNAGDVFASSFLDHLCSYNIFLYNPFKMGIENYLKVHTSRYPSLLANGYATDPDQAQKVSFFTGNRIFAHVIKTRESDDHNNDLFVIPTDGSEMIDDMLTDNSQTF